MANLNVPTSSYVVPPGIVYLLEVDDGFRENWRAFEGIIAARIPAAEKVVENLVPEVMDEIRDALKAMRYAVAQLKEGPLTEEGLKPIKTSAFIIMCKAGFCNYPQATDMARSLENFCTGLIESGKLASMNPYPILDVTGKAVQAIEAIFRERITGRNDPVTRKVLDRFKEITDGIIFENASEAAPDHPDSRLKRRLTFRDINPSGGLV